MELRSGLQERAERRQGVQPSPGTCGMIEASATRSRSTPWTHNRGSTTASAVSKAHSILIGEKCGAMVLDDAIAA